MFIIGCCLSSHDFIGEFPSLSLVLEGIDEWMRGYIIRRVVYLLTISSVSSHRCREVYAHASLIKSRGEPARGGTAGAVYREVMGGGGGDGRG